MRSSALVRIPCTDRLAGAPAPPGARADHVDAGRSVFRIGDDLDSQAGGVDWRRHRATAGGEQEGADVDFGASALRSCAPVADPGDFRVGG